MSKHTPGPWHVSELDASGNTSEYYLFIEPGVAVIERKVAGQDEHDMHDARLIAAAPELLEALRIAREIVVTERDAAHQGVVNPSTGVIDDSDDADWVAEYDRALAQIDAAIAKATGEKA